MDFLLVLSELFSLDVMAVTSRYRWEIGVFAPTVSLT